MQEIAGIRTGRANPQLIENIKADYYGTPTSIKHMAAINVQDAKTIVIQPWDKNALAPIAKAIEISGIGIAPIADKDIIRLSLPDLTSERREQLKKIVREKLEEAKIRIRGLRHDTLSEIEKKEKEKEITEDNKFRFKDKLQKKGDTAIMDLEDISNKKITEIES